MRTEKYFQLFLPRLCQNRVFMTSNYRGVKSPECRARSPPPFLGRPFSKKPERERGNETALLRGDCSAFFRQPKGGESMKPQEHEEHIRHSFDSYCKKVLKRKALDRHRETKRRGEREVTFSDLSARDLAKLTVTDEYFTDEYVFSVLGASVGVSDCELAEALRELPTSKRDIVLMSYFFDMTDKEIAERLNMARRTVAYRRAATLRELKKHMESED
jgi:RNA polymerase sigma factor (sigma-70 family)